MIELRSAVVGAALVSVGIVLGAWLFGGEPAEAQSRPAASYGIESSGSLTFLVNRSTGDTWRFFTSPSQGWQYHALPKRIDGCADSDQQCIDPARNLGAMPR